MEKEWSVDQIRQCPAYQDLVRLLEDMSEDRREALGILLENEIQKNFMSTGEAAKKLFIEPVTVRAWLARGKLKGRRFGGRWRVNIKDVQRILDEDDRLAD